MLVLTLIHVGVLVKITDAFGNHYKYCFGNEIRPMQKDG